MYALPQSNYVKRSLLLNNQRPYSRRYVASRSETVKDQLRSLGLSRTALGSMESRYLPHIIHPREKILGVVYGKSPDGLAMLVATDRRVIYLDKKPLFVNEDEITYEVVSGVSDSQMGFGSTVTLHTRIKDYVLRTFNEKCARVFVEAIEDRCMLQAGAGEESHDYHS